jgi:multidrug resistance efflux pump
MRLKFAFFTGPANQYRMVRNGERRRPGRPFDRDFGHGYNGRRIKGWLAMAFRRWAKYLVLMIAALSATSLMAAAQQANTVIVHVSVSGEVLPLQLARVGQSVKQGEPLVFIRGTTSGAAVPAAVASVGGKIVQVMVRPGDHVNIGDPVAAIQPQ